MIEVPLGKDVFVTSPGYPVSYPIGKVCRWGVKVNELFFVAVIFVRVSFHSHMVI